MFVIWHYLCRTVFPVACLGYAICFLSPESKLTSTVGTGLLGFMAIMGITGAIMGILIVVTPFTLACPICKRRETSIGGSREEGLWLDCKHCGVTHESGFLKLGLTYPNPEEHKHDGSQTND